MYYLKRLFAMLAGAFLLPIQSSFSTFRKAIGVFAIISMLWLFIPPITFYALKQVGYSTFSNLLINVFATLPIATLLALTILSGVQLAIFVMGTIRFFKALANGLITGLNEGMEGVLRVYHENNGLWGNTSLSLAIGVFINQNRNITATEFDGFEQIIGTLQDVVIPQRHLEPPDLQSDIALTSHAELLTQTEIETIQRAMTECTSSQNNKRNTPTQHVLTELKKTLEQYQNLNDKLLKIKEALVQNNLSSIDDELIALNEVITPILLVKQYKEGDEWHHVPSSSHVTDKESLLNWLKRNSTHPLTREQLKEPKPYQHKDTRYIWHELTAEKWHTQELIDNTKEIRRLFNHLTTLLTHQQQTSVLTNSLFSSNAVTHHEPLSTVNAAHDHQP